MAAQLPVIDVPPAGSPVGSRPAVQLQTEPDGRALALALVADPYAAWSYDSASLLRAGAALRTLYGGQHPEPRHHAAMRHAEDTAASVIRIRLAADAAATAATLAPEAPAPAGRGPAPRVRPIAPAPTGAPGAPAAALGVDTGADRAPGRLDRWLAGATPTGAVDDAAAVRALPPAVVSPGARAELARLAAELETRRAAALAASGLPGSSRPAAWGAGSPDDL